MMKNLLVTGGAGFIGSNFIRYILAKYENYNIINLDALTYSGNLENLADISHNKRYIFIKADIRDREKLEEIFEIYKLDGVINFAAESHVDRSIESPDGFISTNINGMQMLLDCAKKSWKIDPDDKYCCKYRDGVKFIQISTDEVYGSIEGRAKFNESTSLRPNNPYSASKASADLIARSYYKTYKMPVNITRCGNNYGPYQFPEKLIPLIINNCLKNKDLPIYGDGKQIRDWIYVLDHCRAIDVVLHHGKDGEIYNIGANNEISNIGLVRMIINILGKSENLIKYVKDRLGHDRRYALDHTKISKELNWQPMYTFDKSLKDTVDWYLDNKKWMENITSGNYQEYYKKMYKGL